jgi:DNA invertase Pin-like site-specific DNA recombinase
MDNIEYVIYCRKSTDESSDNQKQSIPDQIKACIDFAKRENITIKEKPKDFSIFESEYEINKEDSENDILNRRIFQETNKLFIIKEQET